MSDGFCIIPSVDKYANGSSSGSKLLLAIYIISKTICSNNELDGSKLPKPKINGFAFAQSSILICEPLIKGL